MTPREEWLLNSTMLFPSELNSSEGEEARDRNSYQGDLSRNLELTRKAVKMGLALSALDGPLPVMDTIAFVGVSAYTTVLWRRFYLDYF